MSDVTEKEIGNRKSRSTVNSRVFGYFNFLVSFLIAIVYYCCDKTIQIEDQPIGIFSRSSNKSVRKGSGRQAMRMHIDSGGEWLSETLCQCCNTLLAPGPMII